MTGPVGPRRRAGRAALPAIVLTLGLTTLGLSALGLPAQADGPRGVRVTTFVQRDAHGAVVARGATATRAGHPALRPIPAREGRSRVATAHRGRPVVVRHVGTRAPDRTVAVARR